MITIKSQQEIQKMRASGLIAAAAQEAVRREIRPGVTTKYLSDVAEETIRSLGAIPNFKGMYGFPAAVCASVNEEVIHGIPSDKKVLREGDLISIDLGAVLDGYHSDTAMTYPVGEISKEDELLIAVTRDSFFEGMKYATHGNRLSDVSHAIQAYAESYGFSVVREFTGHGIGTELHEDPSIPNYGNAGRGPRLVAGMTLAIEPMINAGTHRVRVLPDRWTVITADGKRSAHYEHTVLITKENPILLTAPKEVR